MAQFLRLTLVLGLVAMIAAGALALTYGATKDRIKAQEKAAKADALTDIFFKLESFHPVPVAEGVTAIYQAEGDAEPLYYAAEGAGTGYNAGVPIKLLVGFTSNHLDAPTLLTDYAKAGSLQFPKSGSKGTYIVGWKVVSSEETPGLGEKAKDKRASSTWCQILSGKAGSGADDPRTDFQRQFSGHKAPALKVKPDGGTVDIITAATISSRGVVRAIQDAQKRLEGVLKAKAD